MLIIAVKFSANAEFWDDFVDIVFYAMNHDSVAIIPRDALFDSLSCRICPIVDYPYDMNFYMTVQTDLPKKSIPHQF